jgi:AcrR family transcriptional regulator
MMRKRIMTGAVEEIREKGIKFTMSDLALRLGVSKRSLYEYFESKEVLVCSIIEALLEDIQKQRLAIMADDSFNYQEKLRKMLTVQPVLFPILEGHTIVEIKRLLHVQSGQLEKLEKLMSRSWIIVEEFLKLGIETGQLRSIYIPIIERMIAGTMNEIIDYRFLADNNVSLCQAKEYMVDILINGLIPPAHNLTI